ncbi:unnamed protein product [Alopecurus aequalis]
MGRRRGAAPVPPVAAVAGSEATSSRKRRRNRRKKSTSTSKKSSSTTAESKPLIDPSLANHGEILVLFETPSGFAIFGFKEYYLNQEQEDIWSIFGEHYRTQEIVRLKKFQIFKDKFSAINNSTGVSTELSEMIARYHHRCQTLAVGNPEYKRIIETSLPGVPCLFDETVMEVMWGLKNLMHSLVPQEKLKLTKEDHLPMSQGLKMFLDHYGFDVKPEMVNKDVVVAACLLYDAEKIVERRSKQLRWAADKLKDVSGINSEGWGMIKIATALNIMFDPLVTTHDVKMFTGEDLQTLISDSHNYEDIISEDIRLKIYSDLFEEMHKVKKDALEILSFWLS